MRKLNVMISGVPCSGKTMLAHLIAKLLREAGHAAVVLDPVPQISVQALPKYLEGMVPVQVEILTTRTEEVKKPAELT